MRTYLYEIASIPRITDNRPPHVITPRKRVGVTDDEQRTLGTGKSDVHTPEIAQETDRLEVETGPDGRQDDDILFLSLKAVDGVESVVSQAE